MQFNPNPCLNQGVVATLRGIFQPLLNALLYPKMTLGHCFSILSAHWSGKKITHHHAPPSTELRWSFKNGYTGGWCNPRYFLNKVFLFCFVLFCVLFCFVLFCFVFCFLFLFYFVFLFCFLYIPNLILLCLTIQRNFCKRADENRYVPKNCYNQRQILQYFFRFFTVLTYDVIVASHGNYWCSFGWYG